MIYAKTRVVDGLYTVKCFNEYGVDITASLDISSEIYFLDAYGTYNLATVVEGSSQNLLSDYLDYSHLYVTLKINTAIHKTYLKTPVVITSTVQQYSVHYKVNNELPKQSNILLERFTYFLPKWSSAYKNDISNYTKITYPFFCNIEKLYYKTSEIVDKALAGQSFYKKTIYNYDKAKIGKITNTDGIELRYTYDRSSTTPSRLTYKEKHFITLENDLHMQPASEWTLPTSLKGYCSKLYVRAPLHTNVIVRGLDLNGAFITETFKFLTLNTKTSKFKFKTILDIITDKPKETIVSNYLDCNTDHFTENFQDIPAFSNKNKKVQFPRLYVNSDIVQLAMLTDASLEYEHSSYMLSEKVANLHMNKFGHIVALTQNGYLTTGILNKNIQVNMPILSNNNVNKYVFVDEVDTELKQVYFSVDCQRLYQEIEELNVIVEIRSEEGVYYLDGLTREIVDKPTSIVISKHNSLKLCFGYAESEYISVTVKTLDESFQASFRNDRIDLTRHDDLRFQTLLLINDNLIVQDASDKYYEVNVEQDYYEINEEGYVTLYEPNSKVYTLKGKLTNV